MATNSVFGQLRYVVAAVSFLCLLGVATAVSVPTRTPVIVHLTSAISSAHAQSGDSVPFVVAENVVVAGYVVIAKGAEGVAVIDTVNPATGNTPGSITLNFKWVRAVDGSKIGVSGQVAGEGVTGTAGDSTEFTSTLTDTAANAATAAGSYGAAAVLGSAGNVLSKIGFGHRVPKAEDGSIAEQRAVVLAIRNPRGVTIVSSQQAEGADADIK